MGARVYLDWLVQISIERNYLTCRHLLGYRYHASRGLLLHIGRFHS